MAEGAGDEQEGVGGMMVLSSWHPGLELHGTVLIHAWGPCVTPRWCYLKVCLERCSPCSHPTCWLPLTADLNMSLGMFAHVAVALPASMPAPLVPQLSCASSISPQVCLPQQRCTPPTRRLPPPPSNCLQGTTDARVDYMDRAVQHAQQASVAATASNQPGLHAAAVLVLGQANMLQAHAVMLEEQQGSSAAQQQSPSSKNGAISSDISSFDAAWLPWVCPQAISTLADPTAGMAAQADQQGAAQSSGEAVAPADGALGVPVATGDSRPASASGSALPAGEGNAAPGADSVAQGDFGCGGVPPSPRKVQLPSAAEKPYQQAIHHLQLALQEALQHQQLSTAEAAARSLMYCYGWLSPEQAAMCAAVAQSCSSSAAMRSAFQQAAALQHPEVLLWRQLEQLEAVYGAGSVQQLQVCACG